MDPGRRPVNQVLCGEGAIYSVMCSNLNRLAMPSSSNLHVSRCLLPPHVAAQGTVSLPSTRTTTRYFCTHSPQLRAESLWLQGGAWQWPSMGYPPPTHTHTGTWAHIPPCVKSQYCALTLLPTPYQRGGTQEAMRPAAIASLLGYTIGLPAAFLTILVVHRTAIFQDQTLRQRNLGNDPASNPNFSTRKRYKELYVTQCTRRC